MGRTTARIGPVLVLRHDLPFGRSYLYAPRPDIPDPHAFLADARTHAERTGALFLRIDPEGEIPLHDLPFDVRSGETLQPQRTVVLNPVRSDEELLGMMHPKMRYNIRLARRHGVTVRWEEGDEAWGAFVRLLRQTSERDRFRPHPDGYYQALLAKQSTDFSNRLIFAYHEGTPVAAALMNYYRGRATYLHGASAYAFRHLMAPHLLHWEALRDMREKRFGAYDLWGIDERRWPGVTRFKRGFGGMEISYPQAYDVVFRPLPYVFYRLQHRLRHRRP